MNSQMPRDQRRRSFRNSLQSVLSIPFQHHEQPPLRSSFESDNDSIFAPTKADRDQDSLHGIEVIPRAAPSRRSISDYIQRPFRSSRASIPESSRQGSSKPKRSFFSRRKSTPPPEPVSVSGVEAEILEDDNLAWM
ncbi:hypothetical protein JAAARDRAFT_53161 [Jaapia argillacea MUCL 33604]|uniref:Uncharacterized protein n=1 Tax=Jaapia argillacea MUCL 33604 TaxID=933084 RepID=A0A067Q9Y9_9AGAM|nr:hypothetical protein JAAARDRAFT_53161 [Jaapia argillacea MUCL 33604]